MAAEAFSIVEVTGPKRSIRLLDRALPYQKLATGREQRYVQRWYPGSPVGSIQVQGPSLPDWTPRGMWKTRFLASQPSVELVGFPDIRVEGGRIVAEDLIEAFNRICNDGQTVDVSWGPEFRRGILAAFTPTWVNLQDVEWECKFAWTALGEFNDSFRVTGILDSVAKVQRSLDDLDVTVAEMPTTITGDQRSALDRAASAVRTAGADFTAALADFQSRRTATMASVQTIVTLGHVVDQAARALRTGVISDLPYYELIANDNPGQVLLVEVWRRDTARSARSVSTQARAASSSSAERLGPGILAIITMLDGMTLRAIAARYYGNADAWTLIADANGIVGSAAPVGARLVIPRPPDGFSR